jgi:Ca2+-transporting ATPase
VFGFTLYRGLGADEARAMTFTTLVIANLALIFSNRSWSLTAIEALRRPNRALWWVTGGTVATLLLVLLVPALRELFQFARLHAVDMVVCFSAGVISILWFEALKHVNGAHRPR